ncbi:putative gustatory receptor 28b [Cydia pomonella]|uniref:putative gustatory receptor 28b n=1 Tax=Cydia pomonella TaxID=82600 RepID=UPI002ADE938F|nr:putative gustatory receptor 28b [Cydia pomonella]
MKTPRTTLGQRKLNNYVDEGMYAEGTLALILRLCICAGVGPLRASRARDGWRFHVSTPLAVLQVVACTVINFIMLIGVILDFHQPPGKRIRTGETVLQAFIWVSDVVLVMVIASLVIYRGPAQMKSLQRVLNQLQQIQFDLSINGPPTKTEKIKSLAMVIMLMWMMSVMMTDFVLHTMRSRSREGSMWTIMLFYGVYYFADLQGALAVVKWACTALAVNEGATALNCHLQRLLHGSQFLALPSQAETLIRRLALSHERISDVMRQMSDTNGLFLMIVLMSTFLRLVLTPYCMLIERPNSEVFGVTLSLFWSLVHVTILILTIEPCHWTHIQRQNTAILLGQLIVHLAPKCERLSKELDQFTKQLMLGDAKFDTLGVYTLDRQLMATILGGVTTYLVIIIQFQTISTQI